MADADVVVFQVEIIGLNIIPIFILGQQTKNQFHGNMHTAYDRSAAEDRRIGGNAFE